MLIVMTNEMIVNEACWEELPHLMMLGIHDEYHEHNGTRSWARIADTLAFVIRSQMRRRIEFEESKFHINTPYHQITDEMIMMGVQQCIDECRQALSAFTD